MARAHAARHSAYRLNRNFPFRGSSGSISCGTGSRSLAHSLLPSSNPSFPPRLRSHPSYIDGQNDCQKLRESRDCISLPLTPFTEDLVARDPRNLRPSSFVGQGRWERRHDSCCPLAGRGTPARAGGRAWRGRRRRLWLSKSPLLCIKGETANASNSFRFLQQCRRSTCACFLAFPLALCASHFPFRVFFWKLKEDSSLAQKHGIIIITLDTVLLGPRRNSVNASADDIK